jgi:hypothetical protein
MYVNKKIMTDIAGLFSFSRFCSVFTRRVLKPLDKPGPRKPTWRAFS